MSSTIFLKNDEFDGQFSRTMQAACVGMADLGEAYATAREIGSHYDAERWHRAWLARADATRAIAQRAQEDGHARTACDAYLRACEYYRQAYFFLRARLDDGRLIPTYSAHVEMFTRAAGLFEAAGQPVRATALDIPYRDDAGDTIIHGWLLSPAEPTSNPRPTIVMPAGYDSTAESGWVYSQGALARGYNVLSVEGPGQGKSLYVDGRYFRPDYEVAFSQILDYLLDRDDVDERTVVLVGRSFAGYLALRAAAHDARLAALVCDPAQPDMGAKIPSGVAGQVAAPLMATLSKVSAERADFFGSRMAAHGKGSVADYFAELGEFTMLADAARIDCPTLVVECPGDPVGGQGRELFDALTCPVKKFLEFPAESGVEGHIGGLGQRPWDGAVYDWLDDVLADRTQ